MLVLGLFTFQRASVEKDRGDAVARGNIGTQYLLEGTLMGATCRGDQNKIRNPGSSGMTADTVNQVT
jgi:hypothetical protein